MLKRIRTKIGDVFCAKVSESEKKYIQLIAYDMSQLNSDVIRAFSKRYKLEDNPSLDEIVNGEVDFYTHTTTRAGVKLSLWEKVGYTSQIGRTDHVLFRSALDNFRTIKEERLTVSHDWAVWHINGPRIRVGRLKGENRKAEIGLVYPPCDIIDRLQTGSYNMVYPDFE